MSTEEFQQLHKVAWDFGKVGTSGLIAFVLKKRRVK
jgi:hypothetical protein